MHMIGNCPGDGDMARDMAHVFQDCRSVPRKLCEFWAAFPQIPYFSALRCTVLLAGAIGGLKKEEDNTRKICEIDLPISARKIRTH